jgi:SAM-dependent methyltransferase
MNKATEKKLLALVKASYTQIADDFNDSRKKQIWPELVKLAGDIDDSLRRQNVLDVGCGNGRLAELFKDRKIDYLGVDSCPELVNLAKQNYGDHFALGDILSLSLLKEFNFDYVFCVAVLHHLPGWQLRLEALKQLKSKIKANGTIIITVWNLWGQKKYRRLILKYWLLKLLKKNQMDFGDIVFNWKNSQGQPTGERYYHAFTERELAKLAKAADLVIDKLYKDDYNYYLILKKAF